MEIYRLNFVCKETDGNLIAFNFLKDNLPEHYDVRLYKNESLSSFSTRDINFALIDALDVNCEENYDIVKGFYKLDTKPIILISNVDLEGANIEKAENLFPNYWEDIKPSSSEAELFFSTFYFSPLKRKIDFEPKFDVEGNGIDFITDRVEKSFLFN